ncbi:hypothetical protein MBANPS3_007502 [Mucor bainieri]
MEDFEIIRKGEIRVAGGGTFRVHRLVAGAFKTKPHPDADIIDHINGTRALNHAENLQCVTQRQNVVFGSGCPAVAINNDTGEAEVFDCIEDLVEMFNQMYPSLKSIMKTETHWDAGNHYFRSRDDAIKKKWNFFYVDNAQGNKMDLAI